MSTPSRDFTLDPRLARVAAFFETLTPNTLQQLDTVYAPSARFIDPFNDVTGLDAIRQVFVHMFQTLEAPRFVVLEALAGERNGFVLWNFLFRLAGGQEQQILGTTHLHFDDRGLILLHHDHWDAASQLYEKLPVLGSLARWLRRRLSAAA